MNAQQPLIEAARLRFNGMSRDSLEDPPDLDEEVVFTVRARCKKQERERMKDGEIRLVAIMEVVDVHVGGTMPDRDDEGPTLFDDEPDDDAE
ncbi:hypothetical protein [Skermania piniformis]|uniref:Uncharacterized protein n=1 Tax=Skermania pinensis TaxID=39122 RepID=A0ABX8SAM5_9ACTN|nr:hypothetical protein [Skermania piniformis]QXQ14872.1 hypothetical protein KV203_05675 [Skermania piniformis]